MGSDCSRPGVKGPWTALRGCNQSAHNSQLSLLPGSVSTSSASWTLSLASGVEVTHRHKGCIHTVSWLGLPVNSGRHCFLAAEHLWWQAAQHFKN